MKKMILIAVMLSGAAHAEFKDGNKLYQQMNEGGNDWFNAIGYVTGVADSLRGVTHCAPSTATAGQIFDMVKLHLQSNPSTRHATGDAIISYVLSYTWPCPKKGNGV
ncbi:MAG: hypothetical protein EBW87_04105 [Burkholderiaceae bacterium]|nr:hypothetical protein [Burkholderiaceae bacterium]